MRVGLGLGIVVVLCGACTEPSGVVPPEAGFLALESRDYAAAEAFYRDALARAPGDPYHLLNLGVALERQGQIDAARAAFEQAQALGQNAPITRVVTDGVATPNKTTVAALAARNLARLGA